MELKIGVIGFGGMASWHATYASKLEGVSFVCAYDIDAERMEKAREMGLETVDSADELLQREDINLVLVATPNHVHREYTVSALRAGKHVLVEKPATMSVADWDEMAQEARRCKKILTVHQNRRWDKDYLTMRKTVEDGLVGDILCIESRVFGTMGPMFRWRGFKEYGGGMVLDWGVHLFDQLLLMFPGKKVIDVKAEVRSMMKQEVEDYFKVLLRLEDGKLLQIEAGSYAFRKLPRWYVSGDRGTMTIEDFAMSEGGITVPSGEPVLTSEVLMTSAGPTRMMVPQLPETKKELPLPVVEEETLSVYRNLLEVLNGQGELIVKHSEVRRILRLIELVLESAETGHSIACSL